MRALQLVFLLHADYFYNMYVIVDLLTVSNTGQTKRLIAQCPTAHALTSVDPVEIDGFRLWSVWLLFSVSCDVRSLPSPILSEKTWRPNVRESA